MLCCLRMAYYEIHDLSASYKNDQHYYAGLHCVLTIQSWSVLHRLSLITCLACSFIFLLPLSSQEISKPGKRNPLAEENVKRGMTQFQQSCGMCHGSEAKGGSGPNLMDSSLVRHDENGSLIAPVLRNGRLERGMPAFPSLHDEQVMDIVAFLHAKIEISDNRSAGGPARGYSLQRLLTGNAETGKQFFNQQGKCATCHSPSGDLAGIAGKYSPMELEARLLYPTVKSRACVVSLPSGAVIKGELVHQDPFYVAVFDADGRYHSWPSEDVTVEAPDPLQGHMELLNSYEDKEIHDVFAYLETLH